MTMLFLIVSLVLAACQETSDRREQPAIGSASSNWSNSSGAVTQSSQAAFERALAADERGDHAEAARLYRPLASKGFDGAQRNLGNLYYYGRGVRQDYEEAARWYRLAALQGNAVTQLLMGTMAYEGKGMDRDYSKAARWYRMAAEQNHAMAQNLLGMMYLLGDGVPEDLLTAKTWLIVAVRNGEEGAKASSRRLDQYLSSAEIAEAERRAEQWLADFRARQAAASEEQVATRQAEPAPAPQPKATTQGGQTGGEQLLSTLGAQLPRASAPKPGAAGAVSPAWEKARQALTRQDYAAAARWLRVEAEQGNVPAMGLLGTLHLDRDGVGRDYGEALRWLRPAAEQGDANAQAALGGMYELGRGLPENRAEAAKWYRLGAESSNAYAQSRLGTMYMSTSGPMPQDDVQAIRWLRAAAEQNEPHAQAMLGLMYAHGRGVEQDLVTAQVWLNLGGAQGSNFGRVLGPDYAEKLTPAQRTEAERRAAAWLRDFQARQPS